MFGGKTRWFTRFTRKAFRIPTETGIGDLPGILSRLDYLKDLGIDVIWLSPVYCSPNDDNGYDISDYRDINPEYGTMRDMDILIEQASKRGIRIIMDLVINHTSDEHEWFKQSRDKNSPYHDYYFWREGRNGKAPNNWTSFFGEDAMAEGRRDRRILSASLLKKTAGLKLLQSCGSGRDQGHHAVLAR